MTALSQPISFEEYYPDRSFNMYASDGDDDDIEGLATEPNLSAYTVEATVLHILVTPEFEWFGMESESSEDKPSQEEVFVEKAVDVDGELDEVNPWTK